MFCHVAIHCPRVATVRSVSTVRLCTQLSTFPFHFSHSVRFHRPVLTRLSLVQLAFYSVFVPNVFRNFWCILFFNTSKKCKN